MAPLLSVMKIVKYCGVWGGGGGAKILQKIMVPPPLSVIKIVMYIMGKNIMFINNISVYCLSPTGACEL